MKCSNCGKENFENSKLCDGCGTNLENLNEVNNRTENMNNVKSQIIQPAQSIQEQAEIKNNNKKGNNILLIFVVFLLICIISLLLYIFVTKKDETKNNKEDNTSITTTNTEENNKKYRSVNKTKF